MYEDGWSRFMQTGQIHDYLAYKEYPDGEKIENKTGEVHGCEYAGVHDGDRDHYQGGTNR